MASSDWEDWDSFDDNNNGNSQQTDSSPQSSFGWDDEPSSEEQQNNFADFGDDESQDNLTEYWDSQQSSSDNYIPEDTPVNQNTPHEQQVKVNLGYKSVGLVLGGIFILLALILLVLSKTKIRKADNVQQPVSQVTQQSGVSQEQPQETITSTPIKSDIDSVSLLKIPSDLTLNYSGDVFEANGTVTGKERYLQGSQVVYCISIKIALGSVSQDVKYYCNYASYNQVNKGDLLIIKYQIPQEGYISINEIAK